MRKALALVHPLALARAVLIGWISLVALSPIAVAADATATIDIRSFAFTPKELTVAPGTHVVWTNRDDTPHTVTATGPGSPMPAWPGVGSGYASDIAVWSSTLPSTFCRT